MIGIMDIRYIAGLFDGEGSVGIYRTNNNKRLVSGRAAPSSQKTYWSASLCIAGTYRPMIEELLKHVPGATFVGDHRSVVKRTPTKVYTQGHCRPSFKVQVQRRERVATFLRRVRPYLWEKADQVDIVLRWADGKLDGATASRMCKKAKRFTFAKREPIPPSQRKRRPSGTESHAAEFTARQIKTIRRRFANGERAPELASEYRVDGSTIGRIARGITYKREGGAISTERKSRRVFSDEEAREIRKRIASGERQNALAKEYGVGTATLNRYANVSHP